MELTPQGTLAERLRAGGAGHPGVLHPGRGGHARSPRRSAVAVRTPTARSRSRRRRRRRACSATSATCSRRRSPPTSPWSTPQVGDTDGNLVFNKTAMNFNPLAAMAGRVTIAQVEQLVEPGEIDPGAGASARGVRAAHRRRPAPQDKRIEKRTVSSTEEHR